MQNEFDDNIKKQVDGFALKPSPQIWERVEAQLPKKKSRRFAFWWWLPGLTILLGVGFYELGLQHNKVKKNIIPDKIKVSLIKEIDSIKVIKNELKNKNIIAIKTKSPLNKKLLKHSKLAGISKSNSNNQNDIISGNLNNYQAGIKTSKTKQINNLNQELHLNKTVDLTEINSNLDLKLTNKNTDSTIIENIKNDSANPKKDTVLPIAKKTVKTNKTLKIKWELTASFGSSNTVGKVFSNGASSNYSFANSATSSTSNPQPQALSLSIPYAGISFAFGVQRTQQINKNWSWYGSFQYAFLSNHQASGAFVDSSLILGNAQSNVSNYYRYGNTVEHLNQIHRFDVSAGFKYTLKPNSSNPFSLYGGVDDGLSIQQQLVTGRCTTTCIVLFKYTNYKVDNRKQVRF